MHTIPKHLRAREDKWAGCIKDLTSVPMSAGAHPCLLHNSELMPDVRLSPSVCLGSQGLAGKLELIGSLLGLNNIIPKERGRDTFVCEKKH